MPTLSIVTMTQNMAENARRCLESVKWADEIVVVDSFSTDGTLEVCREYGARVVQRQYDHAAPQVTFGLEHITSDWVFRIDADEEVTPELAEEIRSVVAEDGAGCDGFRIVRLIVFDGRVLRHGGAAKAATRLARTGRIHFPQRRVHSGAEVDGKLGRLRHHILHYAYADYSDLLDRMNKFSTWASADMAEAGEVAHPAYLLSRIVYEVGYRYFLRAGFIDGIPGLMWCVAHTTYTFAKYAKLWERSQRE